MEALDFTRGDESGHMLDIAVFALSGELLLELGMPIETTVFQVKLLSMANANIATPLGRMRLLMRDEVLNDMVTLRELNTARDSAIKLQLVIAPGRSFTSTASQSDVDVQGNLVLLGDEGIGKSALLRRFHENAFVSEYIPTPRIAYTSKLLIADTGEIVKLQIMDTSGQERYRLLMAQCMRGASALLIAFSVENRKSFELLSEWLHFAWRYLDVPDQTPLVLIGTKADLRGSRKVSENEAYAFAQQHSMQYFEVSAMLAGVDGPFHWAADALLEQAQRGQQ